MCLIYRVQSKGITDLPLDTYVLAGLLKRFQRFAAVIMRIREPKTTALIFASGKMVVTGMATLLW